MTDTAFEGLPKEAQTFVVVGGAMRSGTTVIHRALCTARNANPYISESWFLHDLMNLYRWNLNRYEIRLADQFGAESNFRSVIRQAFEAYLRTVSVKYGDPKVIFLKHPELSRHFVDIAAMFPDMKFIMIVRDPRDVIASMKAAGGMHMEKEVPTPIARLKTTADWCRHYFSYYQRVLQSQKGFGKRLTFIRYEDAMRDPRAAFQSLGNFTGAEFDLSRVGEIDAAAASSKNFDKDLRLSDELSGAFWSDLYTQALTTEQIGRYLTVLPPEEISEIQTYLASFGDRFGYW